MAATFSFGVDYYPEQWPEERWALDARLMAEAGINTVRLAEFGWAKMEPDPGLFNFGWLDRAIEILAAQNIQIVLGTPTASAPPWLYQRHPDAFRVLESGDRQTYGHRRYNCPNHPAYREYSMRITTRMAEHFAQHPAVIGWQIDNEFAQGDRCCCPICTKRFQDWLKKRYHNLKNLNECWGTAFWSHGYSEWSQIPAPLKTAGSPNPGLMLDYLRFSSDSYVDFQREQVKILRKRCPSHLITHNMMGFGFNQLDNFQMARDLDFVSWDCYLHTQWDVDRQVHPHDIALSHAAMRGLKQKNFWVIEQQVGLSGWEIVGKMVRPGQTRLWAYQSIAHGADGILFFRWRSARFGTEQYWHGILNHHGQTGRFYAEIQQMGRELQSLAAEVSGSSVPSQVAIIQCYDSRFAFQIQANHKDFTYTGHINQIYQAFHAQNIAVDVISPHVDLSKYQLVIAPALHVLPAAVAERLESYVASGGVLVITPRSGVKDEANAIVDLPLPGLLARLCGVEILEYIPLYDQVSQVLSLEPGAPDLLPLVANLWCEVLQPTTAQVVTRYSEDYFKGQAAITMNRYQNGRVITVGTFGQPDLYTALLPWLCELASVQPILKAPTGVEVTLRQKNQTDYLFLLNHTAQDQTVMLDAAYTDLITEEHNIKQQISLDPYGVAVLRKK